MGTISANSYYAIIISMKSIEINPTNELHLLRHFSGVAKEYSDQLVGQEYYHYDYKLGKFKKGHISPNVIQAALETTGSKFYKDITGIENPKKLLQLIKVKFEAQKNIHWSPTANGINYAFLINHDSDVGNKNLIKVSELSDPDKKRVHKVSRGEGESSVMVNIVNGIGVRKLKTIEVGVLDSPELDFLFVTAYPGDLMHTEDFPNDKQPEQEYKVSKEFWDNHVFVS